MSIGERRFRVVFQRAAEAQDAFGEPDQTWTNLCTSWALIQPLKGRERNAASQVHAELDTRIVTRNRSDLSALGPGDRATWNGHTYDIRSVAFRDHRQVDLEIMAQEHL